MLGILEGDVSGTGVAIILAGRGVGGAATVGIHVMLVNGMGDGGGVGTEEMRITIWAGVGNDKCMGLDDGDEIVGEPGVGTGIFVAAGLGSVGDVWFGIRVDNDGVIDIFGGGSFQDELIVGIVVSSFVGAGVGTDGGITVGPAEGMAKEIGVCTLVVGTVLGLGHGIKDGTVVVGSSI